MQLKIFLFVVFWFLVFRIGHAWQLCVYPTHIHYSNVLLTLTCFRFLPSFLDIVAIVKTLHSFCFNQPLRSPIQCLYYISTFTHSHTLIYTDSRGCHTRCQLIMLSSIIHTHSDTDGRAFRSILCFSIFPNNILIRILGGWD